MKRRLRTMSEGTGRKCSFFFFQAEDGIRDVAVTGVQTCALPISVRGELGVCDVGARLDVELVVRAFVRIVRVAAPAVRVREPQLDARRACGNVELRSEERRVGKEWRFRGRAHGDKTSRARRITDR